MTSYQAVPKYHIHSSVLPSEMVWMLSWLIWSMFDLTDSINDIFNNVMYTVVPCYQISSCVIISNCDPVDCDRGMSLVI